MNYAELTRCAVNAMQPVIWIRTHENIEAKSELIDMFQSNKKNAMQVFMWDSVRGCLKFNTADLKPKIEKVVLENQEANNPFGAPTVIPLLPMLEHFTHLSRKNDVNLAAIVLVIDNFHHCQGREGYLEILQAIHNFTAEKKAVGASIVLISHYNQNVPEDLKSYATVIDHDLPELDKLSDILLASIDSVESEEMVKAMKYVDAVAIDRIAESGLGLSRLQFESESAFALAVLHSELVQDTNPLLKVKDPVELANNIQNHLIKTIQERKAALFNSEGLVRIHSSAENFKDLGGMTGLKGMVQAQFSRVNTRHRKDRNPRGLILLGPPGTGKSTTCKAIANMLGLLMVSIDVGSLKQGVVGASEGRIRRVFQILRAMRRIVVFIDEIEKVFPTGNELDSGVSADQLSVWLTELSDPKRLYYVVASANQCSKLPAPLLRSGRFDAIVMIDIPKPSQQQIIWNIMRERYGIDPALPTPDHYRWTGAEIEACCDGADAKGCTLIDAAKTVVPVHSLNPEEIKKVQEYAKGRAIDSETGELYTGYFDEPDQLTSVPGSRRGTNRLNPANN